MFRSFRLVAVGAGHTGGTFFFTASQDEPVDFGEQVELVRWCDAGGRLCADVRVSLRHR